MIFLKHKCKFQYLGTVGLAGLTHWMIFQCKCCGGIENVEAWKFWTIG